MIRILICDDSEAFLCRLRELVRACAERSGEAVKLDAFTALEDIPGPVLSGCDIAVLDIDFAGKAYTGLDVARRLRQLRPDAVILFVTNYIEYAPEGYEVNAFRYILKNEIDEKLSRYLAEALGKFRSAAEVLKIRVSGELIDIPLSDIRYIESRQHTVVVRTTRREYTYYAALSALEEQLGDKGFLRIHKSYLVNMAHLTRFQSQQAVLSDGTELRVSARSYAAQKQKYLLWRGRL